MDHLLVDKVSNHLGSGFAHDLVVSLVRLLELSEGSVNDELDDLWQFGVDCCKEGSIDMREARAGHLCLHDCPCQQASSSDQVLIEQLHDNVADVLHIDLVNDSVDTFPKHLPHILLMSLSLDAFFLQIF